MRNVSTRYRVPAPRCFGLLQLTSPAARCAPPQWPRILRLISVNIWMRSSARSLFATLEQPRRFHSIGPGRESRRGTAPAQRLDLLEERRIGAQGREILEEQCEIALFAENV